MKNSAVIAFYGIAVYALSLFAGCSDDDGGEDAQVAVAVYVAGYEDAGRNYVAKVWKNGQAVKIFLTDGAASYAQSVFVAPED